MKLQQSGLQCLDAVLERSVVRIHGQRRLDGTALYQPAKLARGAEADVTGRRLEEHEAHHVRASVQRDLKGLARGQAANFYRE